MSDPHNPYGAQPPYGSQPPYGAQYPGQPPQPPPYGAQPQYGAPAGWGAQYGGAPEDPLISRDYGGWWRRAIAVLKAGWRQLLLLQVIYFVASSLLQVILAVQYIPVLNRLRDASNSAANTGQPDEQAFIDTFTGLGIILVYGLVGSVVLVLLYFLIEVASVWIVVQAGTGMRPSVGDAIRGALPRVFPMLGWGLLAGLITVGLLCLCILPVFYGLAVFLVLPAVVAFERGGAIGRCFKLFHGDLGVSLARVATVAGIAIGVGLILAIISGIVGAITGPATASAPGQLPEISLAPQIALAVIQSAVGGVLTVLLTPLMVLTYTDMRARVEPLSSEVLKQELRIA